MRKIILILTTEEDQSSSTVIEWLNYYNYSYLRINNSAELNVNYIKVDGEELEIEFSINNVKLKLSEISSFWYRRGFFSFNRIECQKMYKQYLEIEINSVYDFLLMQLDKKAQISYYSNREVNKCFQLEVAKKHKLNIPFTLLTTEKDRISKSFSTQNIISKSIQSNLMLPNKKALKTDILYSSLITKKDLKKIPNIFFITKFQKQILKKIELRIFYFDEKFYPMAIFSQKNSQTTVDFREYDFIHPNRTIPYILPSEIKNKLRKVLNDLSLLSGSIDMIVDENDDYYFLEVNPVGQFGMVSLPCNYNLEKLIAIKLMKN